LEKCPDQKKTPKSNKEKNPKLKANFNMSNLGMSKSESTVWVQHYIHFENLVNIFKRSKYILSLTEFYLFLLIISIQQIEIQMKLKDSYLLSHR